jgi:hypothetical protein
MVPGFPHGPNQSNRVLFGHDFANRLAANRATTSSAVASGSGNAGGATGLPFRVITTPSPAIARSIRSES